MRFVTFFFLALIPVWGYAQPNTVIANRAVVKDSLQLGPDWINGLEKDTTLAGATDKTVPTSLAVKAYVDANSGGGGVTDGDKGDIDVTDDGETWLIDTAAVTSIKIATDAVTQAKIANNSVGSGELINKELTPGTYGSATESVRITVDADGRLDSVSVVEITGTSAAPIVESFNDTLDFSLNRYYNTYTQTDTIRFTPINQTNYGKNIVARIVANGDPFYFQGSNWDTLQNYNIQSGERLDSASTYMFYFEAQPYGVAVNVPQNYTGIGDTTGVDPVPEVPYPATLAGLELYLDAKDTASVSVVGTTTTWSDLVSGNGYSFFNPGSGNQPVYQDSLFVWQDGDAISGDTVTLPSEWTITMPVEITLNDDNGVFIGASTFQLLIRPTLLFYSNGAGGNTSIASTQTTAKKVLTFTFSSPTLTYYIDNVLIGTASLGTTGQYISALFNAQAALGQGVDGNVYGIYLHTRVLDSTERTGMFDYLNTRFNLGL